MSWKSLKMSRKFEKKNEIVKQKSVVKVVTKNNHIIEQTTKKRHAIPIILVSESSKTNNVTSSYDIVWSYDQE